MIALHDGIWTTENPRGIATDRTESRNDPLFALIGVFNAWRRDVARSELPVRNCPFRFSGWGFARSDLLLGFAQEAQSEWVWLFQTDAGGPIGGQDGRLTSGAAAIVDTFDPPKTTNLTSEFYQQLTHRHGFSRREWDKLEFQLIQVPIPPKSK